MFLLLAAAAATFTGGTYNDLAKTIAEATTQPVVITLTTGPTTIKGFEFNHTDLDEMARAFRTHAGLMMAPGSSLILHDGLLPVNKVSRGPNGGTSFAQASFGASAIADGKVTFKTDFNQSLTLSTLQGFSKPVEVHWFYTGQGIGVNAKAMPEMDFLTYIGKGIGARFANTPKAFKLDFDPVEVRNRAVRTIQAEATKAKEVANSPSGRQTAFRLASLNSLSPAQLTELFSKQGNLVRTPIRSGSDIERLAVVLIREDEAANQPQTADPLPDTGVIFTNRQQRQQPRSVLQRVDPTRQALLVTDTNFNSWVEVPVGRGNGYETVLRPESRINRRSGGG